MIMKNWYKILVVFGLMAACITGCQNKQHYSMKAAKNALDLSARDTTVNPADNFLNMQTAHGWQIQKFPHQRAGMDHLSSCMRRYNIACALYSILYQSSIMLQKAVLPSKPAICFKVLWIRLLSKKRESNH